MREIINFNTNWKFFKEWKDNMKNEKLDNGENISDISFGAKFIKFLEKDNRLGINIFPEQVFSKNVLLQENKVVITPSSFDLNPIKIIEL